MSRDLPPPHPPGPDGPDTTPLESTFRLLALARAGDQAALEKLFARFVRPLKRWASGRLPAWARQFTDTDDLVQDALVQTFKRIGEFEPRGVGALQAYLRQAVLNRIRDELRRKGRQPPVASLDDVEIVGDHSPLEKAIGRQGVERYEHALERIAPEQRDLVIARVEMGYTYEEMAEMFGKPSADAARKAAQRALVKLLEEMPRGRP